MEQRFLTWRPGEEPKGNFRSEAAAQRAAASEAHGHPGRVVRVLALVGEHLREPKRSPKRAAGGFARAAKLTAEQRRANARKAAQARWHGQPEETE